ncbi:coiled-coil domain-containing protein MTMR15 [Beauveria brongniartii RCEF 3172]|uniref:Fanconi-associated nuclease n=1 Tax=Beauveria brongniartii RCEF 3172 TaxID=1081107 RepID=A0A162KEA9_9HYPO|nr:coiled-coil domain-containing protein MTMR15 [Beauveria brongniartii RCEF 3172]
MDAFVKKLTSRAGSDVSSNATSDAETDGPPLKRLKRDESNILDSEESEQSVLDDDEKQLTEEKSWLSAGVQNQTTRSTDVENALPVTQPDEAALEAYEQYKSSQASVKEEAPDYKKSLWTKGRSSIYVDAFNLALDTVLEDESRLFDKRELSVFSQWKALEYEAQYLYVRLFLRKTAAWHRSSRLGYYNDIANLEVPIATLQQLRYLPSSPLQDMTTSEVDGIKVEDERLGSTFTFADTSEALLTDMEEAASLLYLDELKTLAKETKIQGRTKPELIRSLSQVSRKQTGLMDMGLSRQNSRESTGSDDSGRSVVKLEREDSKQKNMFFSKVAEILGPCIRLSSVVFKLFERVHLVFYRSTEWTEKSLTTIILAKIARRNFPEYIVCRTSTIFASREHLLEFEAAIRLEAEIDLCLEGSGAVLDKGCERILEIFDTIYPRWKRLLEEERHKEQTVYEFGEGAYLRRFNPGHSYTRILAKAGFAMGKFKEYQREHDLLKELLGQKMFHLARRGDWYQRKALLEENYMAKLGEPCAAAELERRKKEWNKTATGTCEMALQDPDCHLTFHFGLQKRLLKLEKKLRIPKRLQHDFGHVKLAKPLEITVQGIQLKRETELKPGNIGIPSKTIWLDELDSEGECSVEEMCLSHFRAEGWKGFHSEGRIVRTLFAYLFYDILFLYIPNVFQTAFQTCPLDLHTDVFFPTRASEINHRLVEIENGGAENLVRSVWEREHERRTAVVGLNWDYEIDDLVELVRSFDGDALAAICKVMAQEYKQRGGGIPDLILWRTKDAADGGLGARKGEVMFVEVKSENDRLSETQRVWIHVLTAAGVQVALCNAVAKEVREVD